MKDRTKIKPITEAIPAERQSAKRHYGVHPYFTRRPHNVVRKHILHYSTPGDVVVDPFGGSGVTAIEAWLENRIGIQNDINPLANFIAGGIVNLAQANVVDYREAVSELETRVRSTLEEIATANDEGLAKNFASVPLPDNLKLPRSSDVERYHELFTRRQLLSLAVIRAAIDALPSSPVRRGMLLAWSASLTKLNRTFLSAEGRAESRGGSSIFSIYRYKIASEPIELPVWQTFQERAQNIIAAKIEIDDAIELKNRTGGFTGEYRQYGLDVSELAAELENSVDYVFTDPPYGGHISYLDLSTLWNSWLGMLPTMDARQRELIVGGELALAEDSYVAGLGESVRACILMLKPQRWLSVVFQHWNVTYFEAILSAAAEAGASLKAAVSQVGDPVWSMHKKKGRESVLAGELILTFCSATPSARRRSRRTFDVEEVLDRLLAAVPGERMYGEALFNRLVVEAWENSAISALNITKSEFANLIQSRGWLYDQRSSCWVRERHDDLALFPGYQSDESR